MKVAKAAEEAERRQRSEMEAPRVLAIMAKYPRPGAVKTRLAATLGAVEATGLYRAFLRDLAVRFARAARQDGYTLAWAQSPGSGDLREVVGSAGQLLIQRGDDFAERLYHVCADLGSAGYQRIIVIGSDSPHLPAAWVCRAFDMLDRCDVVLGPAEDGGYYLAGLRATPAPPDLFRGIRMSTPRVFAETLQRAASLQLNVELLPVTFDVDEAADLHRLARALGRPGQLAAASPHTLEALHRLGVCTGEDATTGSRAG